LLIAIVVTSISLFCFARFRFCGRACCALLSSPRNFFPRGPLKPNWRPVRRFLRCASEAGGRPCHSEAAPQGLARRASAANATTKSGGEAETRAGSGGVNGWAREAQLAEPERASHSAAPRMIGVMTSFGWARTYAILG